MIKIKIAILDESPRYLERIAVSFSNNYSDSTEVFAYQKLEDAYEGVVKNNADVLISSDAIVIDKSKLPKRCAFAYMTSSSSIESIFGEKAICKYQRIDLLQKEIMGVFLEHTDVVIKPTSYGDGRAKVIIFTSPAGGVGTSTVAAACTMFFADNGYKSCYLDISTFGNADNFFTGEGGGTFSDLIYALKVRKTNQAMRIANAMKRQGDAYFFSGAASAIDMTEFKAEDLKNLISIIVGNGEIKYIVVDMPFGLDNTTLDFLAEAYEVVMVSDGSAVANDKINRMFSSLAIIDEKQGKALSKKPMLMYNRADSASAIVELDNIKLIGKAPRYKGATIADICRNIIATGCFANLV